MVVLGGGSDNNGGGGGDEEMAISELVDYDLQGWNNSETRKDTIIPTLLKHTLDLLQKQIYKIRDNNMTTYKLSLVNIFFIAVCSVATVFNGVIIVVKVWSTLSISLSVKNKQMTLGVY